MIYYAYIVKWHKNDPESPGNLKSSQLLEQLAGENIIPEKFEVDIDSIHIVPLFMLLVKRFDFICYILHFVIS